MTIKVSAAARRWAVGAVVAAVVSSPTAGEGPSTPSPSSTVAPPKKHLIELSWTAPDPETFRDKVSTVEKLDLFSGTHLRLTALQDSRVFGAAVPEESFAKDRAELAAATPTTMTENFIRVNSATDDNWDWFDDQVWAGALSNIRNVARTGAAGPVKGITLDPEAYGKSPWHYQQQLGAASHTFAEYEAMVRARGAEFARTLVAEDPDIQIFSLGLFTWLIDVYTNNTDDPEAQRRALQEHNYGLLPAFVNGMLEGAGPDTVLTDGNEMSYSYLHEESFSRVDADQTSYALPLLLDPALKDRYDAQHQSGQAVYLDQLLDLFDKDVPGYEHYYQARPPHFLSSDDRMRLLEQNVYFGLKHTDRYLWVYSEDISKDRFFDYGWGTTAVPDGVIDTMKRAKSKIDSGQELGFDMTAQIEAAKKACKDAVGATYPFNCNG
ncbi:MAG: hypothetical protein ACRCSN_06220 [Dermatophilaceae bacterium]